MKHIAALISLTLLIVCLTAALYLGTTWQHLGVVGLPLDDAWIHQVYARSLARDGCWCFGDGHFSTGSTSPAWTILLALGHLMHLPPVMWALALGGLFHALTGILTFYLVLAWFGQSRLAALAAAATLLEWHLAWAAFSGMETTLFVALCTAYLLIAARDARNPSVLGLAGGLAILTRPEAILLILVSLIYLTRYCPHTRRWRWWLSFGVVLAIPVVPWLGYNLIVSGRPFPGTLYAKRVQWVEPWSIEMAFRFLGNCLSYFGLGPSFLASPFFVLAGARMLREHRTELLTPIGWVIGLLTGYAIILPVLYDRGRYLMPLWPIWIGMSFWALWEWVHGKSCHKLRLTYLALCLASMLVFWVNGARAFAQNVMGIESQHMQVATWLRTHTPSDALVATHDIGVVGYFAERPILDLAGLVSPEVVTIMRDPAQLSDYILSRQADYLVVFPSYYRDVITACGAEQVYVSDTYGFARLGRDPLAIYRIRRH